MKFANNKKGVFPLIGWLMIPAIIGAAGWLLFKVIIGVEIGQAIDNVTKSPFLLVIIVVGAIVGLKIWKSIFK